MTTEQVADLTTSSRTEPSISQFQPRLASRYRTDNIFKMAMWVATAVLFIVLVWLLLDIIIDGIPALNWKFLTSLPDSDPEDAGILAALVGTLWIMGLVALFAFPVGIGSGIFLEEFAANNWLTGLIEISISNLAGVPSIVYGLLGLGAFVQLLGRNILSGALTLALLILPIIIVATREALRAVPDGIRNAGYALGANTWQVIWGHTLPTAFPGILTGVILALSRAIGETAPLIVIGAVVFVSSLPTSPTDPFTVLPIQIYNWVTFPKPEFHQIAASGIIVLMAALLLMNSVAIFLRNRFQKVR